jgi:hypothetical protein
MEENVERKRNGSNYLRIILKLVVCILLRVIKDKVEFYHHGDELQGFTLGFLHQPNIDC